MVGTVKPDVLTYKTADPSSWASDDVMRPRWMTSWDNSKAALKERFGYSDSELAKYDGLEKKDQLNALYMMHLSRQFETACNQAYMQGNIRGFMHLDNGQEAVPALVWDSIKQGDKKYSYYREHTHALASGVKAGPIMAELFGKIDGTCKGAGGSMHIFDPDTNFQGGWALVSEQLPYAAGAARSILLDRLRDAEKFKNDDRISVVFIGEGGSQNGRMAETLNAAAKEGLPLLIIVIDNGRAINTFTGDVAANQDVYLQGQHYGVPGIKVDGCDMDGVLKAGRAVTDYVRTKGPAILQVHTFRFNGHSPADPEHERGRKQEKSWARDKADPIAIFESELIERKIATREELDEIKARANKECKDSVKFANDSPAPPAGLAKELEFPDPPNTDYNLKEAPKVLFFLLSFSYSTQQETSWWHPEATVAMLSPPKQAHTQEDGTGRLIAGVGRKGGGEGRGRAGIRAPVLCVRARQAGGMRRAGLSSSSALGCGRWR
jgi:TPP-dependent pyruvate/acetoin dehydrogenase alpha subunit